MNQSFAPFIPDSAPFSPEQRAWLNGYLAGLFSQPTAAPLVTTSALDIRVYYASQGGTAERLAKKLAKEMKSQGHEVATLPVDKLIPAELATQSHAIFIASTYGDGDPPDHAVAFRDSLFDPTFPRLESLQYSVLCLGDRNYEHFCKFGREIDERLRELGASSIAARAESDVDVDEPFVQWKQALLGNLMKGAKSPAPSPSIVSPATSSVAPRYSRETPYLSEVLHKRALTGASSDKLTMHISLRAEGELRYEAGDACGVLAQNNPTHVDELIGISGFNPSSTVEVDKAGQISLREALLHHFQHTRLTRKTVSAFAAKTQCKTLQALLTAEHSSDLDAFVHGRGLIDLLTEYPDAIETPQELLANLPSLAPRLYSISSSPAAHSGELHCTVAVVRYHYNNREREGVASTMLSDRVAVGERLPVYIQPNKRFRIPADSSAPIIMIGPGTGVAPFRSFLHERQALGHPGDNWLFFGERSSQNEFFYCQELRSMCDNGHLKRLDLAFSRDQDHKIYVQDRMIEHGKEFWAWLDRGASIYVCGDASRMAKDVDRALHTLIEDHGGMSNDAAQEYVSNLHEGHRYHRDVY